MENHENVVDVTPSARRLTGSLRDVGYDFTTALADVVDNSLAAGSSRIDIEIVFAGPESFVLIADNGWGMTRAELDEALRFGSRRTYDHNDLGRYGLGLKTASISQARKLTVATRAARQHRRLAARTLDLGHIESTDRWEIIEPSQEGPWRRCGEWLDDGPGTVVCWEHLDRLLPERNPSGGWAKRRFVNLATKASAYLGVVFHRFLEGGTGHGPVVMTVNGEKIRPWNPFAPAEATTSEMPMVRFTVEDGSDVRLRRFVLPTRGQFSSQAEHERMGGTGRWNKQQGLYIYRADRMIQSGGWSGIRAADEHTKLARAALDFDTDLDERFRIDIAKMKVSLPAEIRTAIERPINELCHSADSRYRSEAEVHPHSLPKAQKERGTFSGSDLGTVGTAILGAAAACGLHDQFAVVMDELARTEPEIAHAIGWDQ